MVCVVRLHLVKMKARGINFSCEMEGSFLSDI